MVESKQNVYFAISRQFLNVKTEYISITWHTFKQVNNSVWVTAFVVLAPVPHVHRLLNYQGIWSTSSLFVPTHFRASVIHPATTNVITLQKHVAERFAFIFGPSWGILCGSYWALNSDRLYDSIFSVLNLRSVVSQRVDCKTEIEATGRMPEADLTVSKRELNISNKQNSKRSRCTRNNLSDQAQEHNRHLNKGKGTMYTDIGEDKQGGNKAKSKTKKVIF